MIKTILHTPWTFMRWLRLAIGLYLVYIGLVESDILAGSIGALFSFLAVFNRACQGQNCQLPKDQK